LCREQNTRAISAENEVICKWLRCFKSIVQNLKHALKQADINIVTVVWVEKDLTHQAKEIFNLLWLGQVAKQVG
jgi:hypothetical protein